MSDAFPEVRDLLRAVIDPETEQSAELSIKRGAGGAIQIVHAGKPIGEGKTVSDAVLAAFSAKDRRVADRYAGALFAAAAMSYGVDELIEAMATVVPTVVADIAVEFAGEDVVAALEALAEENDEGDDDDEWLGDDDFDDGDDEDAD